MEDLTLTAQTATEWLEEAFELDQAGGALDMRRARLLAVLKCMNLAALGYSSFRAFCAALVEGCDTRIRQFIKLAECPFAKVRAAVVGGRLAPSVAIRGLSTLDAEGEAAWLADALAGHFSRPPRREPEPEVEFTGENVRVIHAARVQASIDLGQALDDALVDRHILGAWRAREPRQKLLKDAQTPPPAPAPLPIWEDAEPDPADALVGHWQEPADPGHALALLRMVTAVQQDRVRQLGLALEHIAEGRMYEEAGFTSFASWARHTLSVDVRTLQRYRKALEAHPDLDLDRALFIEDVATEDTCDEWCAIAPKVPVAELSRVRILVNRGAEQVLREAYTRALALLETLAPHATDVGKPRFVSLAATLPPPRAPRATVTHPDMPEAARWYLVQAKPPKQHGTGWVKVREAYTCVNPECAVRTRRLHVHHRRQRRDGGGDEGENLHGLCPGCHLRVLHSGHLRMERRGEWLEFSFADRVICMLGYPAFG